ncbi:putative glutamyl-tRNA amidotransferase subunit A [Rhypophila decipiens]|uniref:Glutamyl-tRNA amidotransferase subunit A n=1 Tax=Rhypophila decipiens TaxID=261697 RepID=A0AAN7BD26_9PEZI|nr:putative glutamyl-tRNA amidotransferase subunit A [Rhypophila decipiens]
MDLPTVFPSNHRLEERPDSQVQSWKRRVMLNRLSIFILSLVGVYIFVSEACELAHEQFLFSSFAQEGTILGSTELGSFPSLIDASIEDLAAGLESGLFTSVDLVTVYTARIEEVNSILKAVTEINPDALEIAAALDASRASGTVHGPLHGIPILIKNNIATLDKMNNTAGSYSLLGAKVPEDSTIAAKLRMAGAIIFGKANLSQWANYRSSNSSNGWSSHGGQVEGAYYPQQDASGSSSGSGVAASLGLAAATVGTETDGSIISPADHNNIVGIKPTVGLTSRHLVIPISEHQDTIGPMARTVKDAAYMLSAIAGQDINDNYTSSIPFETNKIPDYVSACDFSALKGKRIGVPRNLIDTSSEYSPILASFNESLDVLREAGATIVDAINLPGYDPENRGRWYETNVIEIDFVANLKSYFSKLSHNPHNITSLLDMKRFTQTHASEEWPQRDIQRWEGALNLTANGTSSLSAELWGNYTSQLDLSGRLGITGALENYTLDALVVPSIFESSLPARLGSPVISVPMGRYPSDTPVKMNGLGNLVIRGPNMPFGISFLAERFSEEKLIGLAYAFEQRTLVREKVRPYIAPKTELGDVVLARGRAMVEESRSLGHEHEGTVTKTSEVSEVDL